MNASSGYHTRQREMIVACLKEHRTQHVTVDSIMAYLKAQGAAVGQTTVYRNLDKLTREGLVVKYAGAEGQAACFQFLDCDCDQAVHYHLICVDCGQMIHLQCEYMDELTAHVLEHHQFSIDRYKTVIYGLCNQCASRKV